MRNSEASSTFQTGITYFLLGLVFFLPLLIIPVFTNFMITTKILILLLSGISLFAALIWNTVRTQTLNLPKSPILAPLFLLGLGTLASSLLTTRYPIENLTGLGGAYLAAIVVALAGSLLLRKNSSQDLINTVSLSGVVLTVLTLLQSVGFGPSRLLNSMFGISLPHTNMFNLAGSPFLAAQFLGLIVITLLVGLFSSKKLSTLQLGALIVTGIGFALNAFLSLPGKEASPLILPFGLSWSLAFDVMKSPRSALIGVGPESYGAVYTQLRPAWTNGMAWWTQIFGQGFNVPLTLLVTQGLVSFAAWVWLLIATLTQARTFFKEDPMLVALTLGTFALQLAFPNNIVIMTLQAVSLAFLVINNNHGVLKAHLLNIKSSAFDFGDNTGSRRSWVAAIVPSVLAGLVLVAGFYGVGRVYAASYNFFQSSVALQKNDIIGAYERQAKAIELNPYQTLYRSNFAITNLTIASALAQKSDATEQDKAQVGELIQQAIREAKAGTELRPDDTQTWRVLAQIYQNLIGSAEGADQWTVTSYVEAIKTHPSDPTLRLDLGSVFYGAQNYSQAAALFQQAAELKPDLPNPYYNLANALVKLNDLTNAKAAYQQTLTLIPADSEDYTKAAQELADVEKALATQSAQTTPGTTGLPTSQSSTQPSLLNENLNSGESVVTQPTPAGELTTPVSPQPQPSISPLPAASPTL